MADGEIVTRVALAGWDDHRFHGHSVFRDLVGKVSLTALFSLSVTGRMPSEENVRILDEIAGTLTVADPRIWPLKVARIASAFGYPILGWSLGALSQDRALIGSDVPRGAADWLVRYAAERAAGGTREAVAGAFTRDMTQMPGFGVPVRPVDERVRCLEERLRLLGRERLPHWCALMEVAEALADRPRMVPNIAGAVAAVLLDCGYSPQEVGHLVPLLPHHAFVANAVEGAIQAPAILRRLPAEAVSYRGPAPRESPRAKAARAETVPED